MSIIDKMEVHDVILDFLDGKSPVIRRGYINLSRFVELYSPCRSKIVETKKVVYTTYLDLSRDELNVDNRISSELLSCYPDIKDDDVITLIMFKSPENVEC